MTEIPQKQEGQTWINYLLERMKEKGLDATLECKKSDIDHTSGNVGEDVGFNFHGQYDLSIQAYYSIDCDLHYDKPPVDAQGFIDDSPRKILGWGDFNNLDYHLAWLTFEIDEYHHDDFFRITFYHSEIEIEARGEPIEQIVKKMYKLDESEQSWCDFLTDISGTENELVCKMVDYMVQRNKGEQK